VLDVASGAYVGPTCWAVMFLAAAAAVLHERSGQPKVPYRVTAETTASGLNIRRPNMSRA